MQWAIEPATARAICAAVDDRADDLDLVVATLAAAFEAAAQIAGGATAAALAEIIADPFIDELSALRSHVATVTATTRDVIGYYETADLGMAAETQRDMASVLL